MRYGYVVNKYVPARILHAFAPLWRRFTLEKRDYREYLSFLASSDLWSRERLLNFQWVAMRQLLLHCEEKVPFYRETWKDQHINISDILCYKDLENLPILTKRDVREHTSSLIAYGVDERTLVKHETGGSTGLPLVTYYDRTTELARLASSERWNHYAGMTDFRQGLFFMGHAHSLLRDKKRWGDSGEKYFGTYFPLMYSGHLACTNLTDEVMSKYCDLLTRIKPRFLRGYTRGIYLLADYCYRRGREFDFLKAVMTSSEMLEPRQREITRAVWNCDIFDRYGMGEEVVTASECQEHNGYHIDMVKSLVETVDEMGRQVWRETGRIIGTSLTNFAMPLVRYDIGDLGELTEDSCPCGRQSQMLSKIIGRRDDFILTPSGRRLTGAAFNQLAKGIPTIREYQIVQRSVNRIIVRITPTLDYDQCDEKKVFDFLRRQLEPAIEIGFEYLDFIPRQQSGKLRLILSECQLTL